MINKTIYNDFNNVENVNKFFVRLEDVNQNYNIYEKLHIRFEFENKLTKKQFYDVINKAPNKGHTDKYRYKNWNKLEKKEFENIINEIFPHYDEIKTNIQIQIIFIIIKLVLKLNVDNTPHNQIY